MRHTLKRCQFIYIAWANCMLQKLAAILTSLIRNKSPSNISELHQAIRGMIILILILFVTWDVRVFIMILAQSVGARHAEFFPRVRESTCSATTVLLPGLCKSRWHSINYSFGPVLSSFGHGCSMGFLLNWAQQPAARGRQAPRTTTAKAAAAPKNPPLAIGYVPAFLVWSFLMY